MLVMCGRYVSPEEAEIERFWHIGRHNDNPFGRRYNVSPTSIIPIIRLDRSTGEIEIVHARWGLIPVWWKDTKPPRTSHNVRSEEAATKPMWKGPLSKSRCLVPALGWYEWKAVERVDPQTGEISKTKHPHFFHLPGNALFSFAGLMAMWKPADKDTPLLTCSILTRGAVASAAEVHERMPVVISRDSEDAWLDPQLTDGEQAITLAREHALTGFQHHAVNGRVNAASNDDAVLIEP